MDVLKSFPPNSSSLTPITFLERAAQAYGEHPSIVYNNTSYTWEETHRRCVQAASSISSLGVKRGDVVSVLAPNIPATYELHYAVPMAGAILNNLNTRLDPGSLSVLLRHCESRLVFVDHFLHPLLLRALSLLPPSAPRPVVVVIKNNEGVGMNGNNAVPTAADQYEELISSGDQRFEWSRPRTEWDPIALNYTSGTTSSPKGVVVSHRGCFVLALDTLLNWSVPGRPVYLWTLPMFHANGWSLTWGTAAVGATNVCLRKFDAPTAYDAIREHNVTHMCGAPIVLNLLANMRDAKPLPTQVNILTAGSPPPASVLSRAEALGFKVSHGYGLTETAGLIVYNGSKPEWDNLPALDRAKFKARQGIGSLGMTEVDVLDPKTGQPVKRNGLALGEVVLRGTSIMLGYLKDPEGTSKAMTPTGWFRTGDVGVIHSDGYLEIKDRLKDIIISGGENISSVEVESVLYTHPAVDEAAVVARPNEFWGETPCAFVSLKKGSEYEGVTEKEVREYCRQRMAHYMVPRTVVFQDQLPKTSTGKIQKFLLREMAKDLAKVKVGTSNNEVKAEVN